MNLDIFSKRRYILVKWLWVLHETSDRIVIHVNKHLRLFAIFIESQIPKEQYSFWMFQIWMEKIRNNISSSFSLPPPLLLLASSSAIPKPSLHHTQTRTPLQPNPSATPVGQHR
jgi:hypothetical protein